jgi:hypothetical protein
MKAPLLVIYLDAFTPGPTQILTEFKHDLDRPSFQTKNSKTKQTRNLDDWAG